MSKRVTYKCDFCGTKELKENEVLPVGRQFHVCVDCKDGINYVFARIGQYTQRYGTGGYKEEKMNEMFDYLKKESDNQLNR